MKFSYVVVEMGCDSCSIDVVAINWCCCGWIVTWVYIIMDWWWEMRCCCCFVKMGQMVILFKMMFDSSLYMEASGWWVATGIARHGE